MFAEVPTRIWDRLFCRVTCVCKPWKSVNSRRTYRNAPAGRTGWGVWCLLDAGCLLWVIGGSHFAGTSFFVAARCAASLFFAACSTASFFLCHRAGGFFFGHTFFGVSAHGFRRHVDKSTGSFVELYTNQAHIALCIGFFAHIRNGAILGGLFFNRGVSSSGFGNFASAARFSG